MKNILISCISKFDRNKLDQGAYTYQNQDLTVTAYQTNEACLKYLLSRLGADDQLDVHIRVQSNDVAAPGDFTMEYLNGEIGRFCGENGFSVPQYFDVFLGEDEQYHRFDRVLSEISKEVQRIAADDPDITIHLDMAGGKRDNFIFIQLLTKLLSYYGYSIHAYYTDADFRTKTGTIVNTDRSFQHMEVLDAVNDFVQHGSATALRAAFSKVESPSVKALLKTMEEFSDSIQLCATDLSKKLEQLDQQLEQVEKYVEDDSNGLFMIKAMIPLIRSKFHISHDSGSRGIIGIVRWCLENGLVQQALTIYNENIADIIYYEKLISIDMKVHGTEINRMMKDRHPSEENNTRLLYVLGRVFDNMFDSPDEADKELCSTLGRYRKKSKERTDRYGNRKYNNYEWTIAAIFFDEKYLPDGVRLNVPSELMQRIFSDSRFAVCARNRVNHASNIDTYENLIISLFNEKRYPFSSYPNTFTPKNVTKDMKRALDNLEKALDGKE